MISELANSKIKTFCVKKYKNVFKKICFVRLKFIYKCYIVSTIGNENKQMWFATLHIKAGPLEMEVVL